jgi:hypothetical protein
MAISTTGGSGTKSFTTTQYGGTESIFTTPNTPNTMFIVTLLGAPTSNINFQLVSEAFANPEFSKTGACVIRCGPNAVVRVAYYASQANTVTIAYNYIGITFG